MQITINRTELLETLAHVAKASPAKATIPILEGVLIESVADAVRLTCTDGSFSICGNVEEQRKGGYQQAVIPAKKLLEVVKKLAGDEIDIEVDGGNATVRSGRTKVLLPALEPEDFPEVKFPEAAWIEFIKGDFERLVNNAKYAVGTNEATPLLTNVLFAIEAGKITSVATDRHRLAQQMAQLDEITESNYGRHVAPIRFLDAVSGIKTDKVRIAFTGQFGFAEAGGYQFRSNLIDGAYPETSRVIPTAFKSTITVDTRPLLQALELADKVINEKAKVVRMDFRDAAVTITARDGSYGMSEVIDAAIKGEEMQLSLNAKYLADAVRTIETDQMRIRLAGQMSPLVIDNGDDSKGLHLVLPYRT